MEQVERIEVPRPAHDNASSREPTLYEPHAHGDAESSAEKRTLRNADSKETVGTNLTANEEYIQPLAEVDPPATEDVYPDGGRGWLVLAGAVLNTFSTFGYVNAWGVFQSHYSETILADTSPSAIAWIGSMQYSLVFFPSLIVGPLFDLGYFNSVLFISSLTLVVATFLIAQCKEYYQFVLCQGLLVGIACGGTFGPSVSVLAHWFDKKRGLAFGLSAFGSSIGGTVIPIMARRLIPMVGFQWTMRIIGFLLIVTLGFSNLTMRRRLPPKKSADGIFIWKAFRNPAYSAYCASGFVSFLGIYTVLTFIDTSAIAHGVSDDFSFYLISIANASSGIGRLIGGVLSDKVGPVNVMLPLTLFSAIATYAWPFATTMKTLIVIAVIYGFFVGSYVSLIATPIMALGDINTVGRRVGMFMGVTACGALVGPPISGAIYTNSGGYEAVGYWAGSATILGISLMLLTRYLAVGWTLSKF